jgi:hypothetical protein
MVSEEIINAYSRGGAEPIRNYAPGTQVVIHPATGMRTNEYSGIVLANDPTEQGNNEHISVRILSLWKLNILRFVPWALPIFSGEETHLGGGTIASQL